MINEKNIGKIYDVKKIFYIEDDEIEMLKNIYFALNEYQNIEGEYTITLNRIFSFIKNYDNSNSLINLILIKIKEFFKNKVNHHLDLYNSLQREICPILGNLLSKESLNFENIKFNYLQILEEWKLNKNNLNIQKDDYSKYGLKYINLLLERIRNFPLNHWVPLFELPDGYNTKVGDSGICLSGGQRQMVSIARALLKNTSLIILDEATSALDEHTESTVIKGIEKLMSDKTIIIISHHFNAIKDVDRVFVLDDGCIVATGTPQELIGSRFISPQ